LVEDGLDVPDIVHQVGEHHNVELASKRERMRVPLDETEARVSSGGVRDHLTGQIETDADPRLQRREEITAAATDLQNPKTRSHDRSVDLDQAAPVTGYGETDIGFAPGHRIPVGGPHLLVALEGRVDHREIGARGDLIGDHASLTVDSASARPAV
jgi:hypothetical protein